MWDNAGLLRNIANAFFALSVLMMLYGAIHYAVHLPNFLPLRSVRLDADPQRVAAADILRAVHSEVRGNLFTVDIERVRQSLETLPWVRSVSIRREFPNRLAVQLEEHQALAHWSSGMLVNRQGEVFSASTDQLLPEFTGPEGSSSEVAAYYGQFSRQLAKVDLQMAQIILSQRHAWKLRLSNGVVLELGREDMQQRLARFVEVYPYSLAAELGSLKYVDLRYRNGFAVGGLEGQS
ncbi:MAG: cell division protein FtsQ/DivIB [Nitrosomonadales bacterium]|nr:cell division protein FtsQ/DivIB [Nitrosomonadales bacterium]